MCKWQPARATHSPSLVSVAEASFARFTHVQANATSSEICRMTVEKKCVCSTQAYPTPVDPQNKVGLTCLVSTKCGNTRKGNKVFIRPWGHYTRPFVTFPLHRFYLPRLGIGTFFFSAGSQGPLTWVVSLLTLAMKMYAETVTKTSGAHRTGTWCKNTHTKRQIQP